MDVSAIFEQVYQGKLNGAVWLLDTPENRRQFEKASDLDPNSALFSSKYFDTLPSALVEMVWSIHDHYPELTSITFVGVVLSPFIASELEGEYLVEERDGGFICYPAKSD